MSSGTTAHVVAQEAVTQPATSSSAVTADAVENVMPPQLKSFLLLNNVGKKHNFGQLIRSAMAFGASEVGVVGAKKIQDLQLFGNQGTAGHCDFRFFDTLRQAQDYFHSRNAEICGIEIGKDCRSVFQVVPLEAEAPQKQAAPTNPGTPCLRLPCLLEFPLFLVQRIVVLCWAMRVRA